MGISDTPGSGGVPISRRTLAAGTAWSVPLVMSVSAAPAFAASGCSGPRFSQAQAGGWFFADRVEAADASFAFVTVANTNTAYQLTATNVGFTTSMVPSGSTIVSVQIEVRWYVTDSILSGTGPDSGAWFQIDAMAGGSPIGNQYQSTYDGSNWPGSSGTAVTTSYFLAGSLPTAAQVVDPTFGARIGFGRPDGDAYAAFCDFIRITVCYR